MFKIYLEIFKKIKSIFNEQFIINIIIIFILDI
jgi:hypothetical protein